eukprot:3183764-Ditylum_brightwellii.AAC.1
MYGTGHKVSSWCSSSVQCTAPTPTIWEGGGHMRWSQMVDFSTDMLDGGKVGLDSFLDRVFPHLEVAEFFGVMLSDQCMHA